MPMPRFILDRAVHLPGYWAIDSRTGKRFAYRDTVEAAARDCSWLNGTLPEAPEPRQSPIPGEVGQ